MTKRPSDDQEPQPQADERNIVPLDSSYEGASMEDRLFLFWNDYQKIIIATVVVAVVALVGWGAIVIWQERREVRIQSEYQEAVTIDEKKAFAEQHSPHRLAGATYLEIADYYFNNQDYETAADFYRRAAADLDGYPIVGRALVGQGFSLDLSDRRDEAIEHLEGVGDNTSVYEVFRAEAFYHAAVMLAELEDTERAWDLAGRVAELDPTQIWARRALQLRASLPQAEDEDLGPQMPMQFQQPQAMPQQQAPAPPPGPMAIPPPPGDQPVEAPPQEEAGQPEEEPLPEEQP